MNGHKQNAESWKRLRHYSSVFEPKRHFAIDGNNSWTTFPSSVPKCRFESIGVKSLEMYLTANKIATRWAKFIEEEYRSAALGKESKNSTVKSCQYSRQDFFIGFEKVRMTTKKA